MTAHQSFGHIDQRRLADLLGRPVTAVRNLGARHSWTLHRVTLADGLEVFVKAGSARAEVFAAEAAGLLWLGENAPAHLVPEVLAVSDGSLVLPWISADEPTPAAAEQFGRDLAVLHTQPAPCYGADWPGYIADLPLDNTPSHGSWAQWYAQRRLTPFLRLGGTHLAPDEIRAVEQVIADIDRFAGPPEPPRRIHGDLWSGNVLWSHGHGVVIDPAAHGGHRETDLAMLALFGTPHLGRILAAYNETLPLADGWRDRIPLHQLHPLLVHLALFGAGYRQQVVDTTTAILTSAR
ncbi:MAG: fructosamine kinase family protein [Nocardia sp.]|nr:fructosamine kinase family protein [Nocardia sp.]